MPLLASFAHECLARGRTPAGQPEIEAVLDAVRDAMGTIPRRYCIIAGADLAHVGPRFGDDWPAGPTELTRVQSEDRGLLTPVSAGDAEGFFAEALRQRDRNRICGLSPIYALLRLLPGAAGKLLHYEQWPDPRGRGHLRQRGLRGSGVAPMIEPPSASAGAPQDPGLSGAFRIDREGAWRHEEVEVTHPGVLRNLYANLRVDSTGHYLQAGPLRVPVQVDDAPFVVVRAQTDDPDTIEVHLSDGIRETPRSRDSSASMRAASRTAASRADSSEPASPSPPGFSSPERSRRTPAPALRSWSWATAASHFSAATIPASASVSGL